MRSRILPALLVSALALPGVALAQADAPPAAEDRPGTIGFGLGWSFGSHAPTTIGAGPLAGPALGMDPTVNTYVLDTAGILSPDFTGIRFRVDPRLTLEGRLGLGVGATDLTYSQDGDTVTSEDVFRWNVELSLGGRQAILRRGAFDLELLGRVSASYGGFQEPETTENRDPRGSMGLAAQLSWGLGGTWYALPNLGVSASATNRIVSVMHSRDDRDGASPEGVPYDRTTRTDWEAGLTFDPTFSVMAHLWF